jgi:putative oxidoreductase
MIKTPSFLKNADLGLLILRLGIGVLYIFHGVPKYFRGPDTWAWLGSQTAALGNIFEFTYIPLGLVAATAEAVGGVLLILGLYFRTTCVLLAFTMLVAFLSKFPIQENWLLEAGWPLEMGIVFAALIFIGPGRFKVGR